LNMPVGAIRRRTWDERSSFFLSQPRGVDAAFPAGSVVCFLGLEAWQGGEAWEFGLRTARRA